MVSKFNQQCVGFVTLLELTRDYLHRSDVWVMSLPFEVWR